MTRLALYATIGFLLAALGQDYTAWGFWATMALFMCVDFIARREGYERGMVFIATLPQEHLDRLRQEIKQLDNRDQQ
jgi:hypothetical protein